MRLGARVWVEKYVEKCVEKYVKKYVKRYMAWGLCVSAVACGSGQGGDSGDTQGTGASHPPATTGTGDLGLTGSGGNGPLRDALTPTSACVSDTREGEQLPIDLYLMVDTTGSMMCPTGPDGARCSMPPSLPVQGATRWSEVKKALDAFVRSSANAGIGVGVGFFPRAATGDRDQPGAVACKASDYVTPAREIALLPAAADDIVASIDNQEPSGSTPTLASLQGAIQYATTRAATDLDRRVAIVYATDGIPQGCDASNTIANAAVAARTRSRWRRAPVPCGTGPTWIQVQAQAAGHHDQPAPLVRDLPQIRVRRPPDASWTVSSAASMSPSIRKARSIQVTGGARRRRG